MIKKGYSFFPSSNRGYWLGSSAADQQSVKTSSSPVNLRVRGELGPRRASATASLRLARLTPARFGLGLAPASSARPRPARLYGIFDFFLFHSHREKGGGGGTSDAPRDPPRPRSGPCRGLTGRAGRGRPEDPGREAGAPTVVGVEHGVDPVEGVERGLSEGGVCGGREEGKRMGAGSHWRKKV